jgi:hypothetical protein
MDEDDVCKKVSKYLEDKHPSPKIIGDWPVAYEGADIIVFTPKEQEGETVYSFHLQVECKGSRGSLDDALAKSLRYYTKWNGLRTYVALPEDHPKLRILEEIFNFTNLPIGLYVVGRTGEITEKKLAQGRHDVVETRKW